MSTFNSEQIVFSLNQIANAASSIKASQQDLQNYAHCVVSNSLNDAEIIGMIGSWQLVWGPVIYQAPNSDVSDNAMFVAKNDSGEYVVAIAGTNPISTFGWFVEDFRLSPPQEWSYVSPQDPSLKISYGTSVGLDILRNKMEDNGQSIEECLKGAAAEESNPVITFTGHSLGGALSPTLAMSFKDQQGQSGGWDPSANATIKTLFTAGPTPGNDAFASHFNSSMGGNANRVWNSIDMVPHAWQVDQLQDVNTFYMPHIEPNVAIDAVQALAIANSEVAGAAGCVMTQLLPNVAAFPGTYNDSLPSIGQLIELEIADRIIDAIGKKLSWPEWEIKLAKSIVKRIIMGGKSEAMEEQVRTVTDELASDTPLKASEVNGFIGIIANLLNFLIQAAYQHVNAYPIYMGTTAFNDRYAHVAKSCHL